MRGCSLGTIADNTSLGDERVRSFNLKAIHLALHQLNGHTCNPHTHEAFCDRAYPPLPDVGEGRGGAQCKNNVSAPNPSHRCPLSTSCITYARTDVILN